MDAKLGILGTTALLLDGGPDDTWGRPRERAVLATLLAHANELVPVEELVRWVWPRDKPAPLLPGSTFDTYAARIRRVLARLPSPPQLLSEEGGYRLVVDSARLDVHEFRALVREARARAVRSPQRAIELVEGALWLWRGLPLADLTTEPARAWRERVLHDDWLVAHTTRVQAFLDLGRYDQVFAALDELQADFPDDLELAKLRLRALYRRGRVADATSYFLATWHRMLAGGEGEAAQLLRQCDAALAEAHPPALLPEPIAVPHQLPDDVPEFVGRREELATLDGLGTTGLVVLDGPGGVGKTALAVHWAHRVRDRFPDGEVFVAMRGFSARAQVDADAVVDDLLDALGYPPNAELGRRQRERLLGVLVANRRILVVLDNARDADQVRRLAGLLPSCLVVVTSRRRLPLPPSVGARRVSVHPLSPENATVLLSVRTHGRIADAARISTFCGGLPLLLTVLAGQLTGKSPSHLGELVTRLDRRRLLAAVDGRSEPPPGESCLTWAYQALAAPERRLFRLLALHPGGDIPAEAAYACDGRPPADTIRSLMCLVAANLLEPSDDLDRFSRHDVLAEFATRCLEREESAEDRGEALERLLAFYLASATSAARLVCGDRDPMPDPAVLFTDAAEALTWFLRERFTLVTAMRHAQEEGRYEQVRRLVEPVAALLHQSGRTTEARSVWQLAVEATRATDDRDAQAIALHRLGTAHLALAEHEAAERCLRDAANLAPSEEVALLDQLGQLVALRGEWAEALTLYRRGLAAAEQAEDVAGLAWLHCRMGQVLRVSQQVDEALDHLRQAQTMAWRAGERSVEAAGLAEMGAIHRDLGDASTAFAYCEEALAIAESVPDLTASAMICVTLSTIGWERRWFDLAVAYSRRGVELLRGTQDLAVQARVATAHGDALHHSGEPHEAALMWHQAADLYDHAGFRVPAVRLRSKMESHRMRDAAPPPARATSPTLGDDSWPTIRHIVNGSAE